MRRFCWLVVLVGLCVVGLGRAEPKLHTIDGKVIEGELVNVTDKDLVLKTKAGEVTTANDKILELDLLKPGTMPKSYIAVELLDGSLLHCSDFQMKQKEFEAKLVSGQTVKVPLSKLLWMVRDAHNAETYKKFREIMAGQGNRDIFVANPKGVLQPLEGNLKSSAVNDKIFFSNDSTIELDLPMDRVHGLIFFRPNREAVSDKVLYKLHDTAKSVLVVEKSEKTATGLKVTTVNGAVVELPLDQVSKLDFNKGQLTFLSNLDPEKVVEKSSLGGVDHYRRDKNLDGGKLKLLGKEYDKGLAMHAYTELVYDISAGEFKEFKALMGIDEQVGGDSHVKVTIEADDQELFSAELRRADRKTVPIAINITGKKKLRIVVRSANLLDLGDHVDLVEARVTK